MIAPWKKSYDQPRENIKKQRYYFADKGPSSQSYGFSSSQVWMWVLDCEESWALKNWCFWTVALEKTLDSPLDCKNIQPVHPKVNQSWIFIGRTDAEAETPLWPPDVKTSLTGKDPGAREDWRREEQGTTEDEMVGWHHRPNGHEFECALGAGDAQGGLLLPSPLSFHRACRALLPSVFLTCLLAVSSVTFTAAEASSVISCLQSCFPPILPLKGRTVSRKPCKWDCVSLFLWLLHFSGTYEVVHKDLALADFSDLMLWTCPPPTPSSNGTGTTYRNSMGPGLFWELLEKMLCRSDHPICPLGLNCLLLQGIFYP